ncbi:signal transduction histidine kinase [Actinocrispum wychmicini]|uniref:histidine kinase n=1 Tax=Actinocrispum wychmicini TaxID=1213861 RepID=A0A4R2JYZ8_9PSEU|nr:signal transduction histidine kinase [Actinocrispum wychmicini]
MPATHRWLLALLGGALFIDLLLATQDGQYGLGALPGGALMVACAIFGARKPTEGALAGALVMVMSTGFIRVMHIAPTSIGINDLLLSEMASGVVLVVLVVWRSSPAVSAGCTTMLVLAAVLALFVRTGQSHSMTQFRSLQLGLLLLVGAVVVGVYLRNTNLRRTETELGALVRRQWPLAAALVLLLFLDVYIGNSGTHILAMAGAVLASVCAFFAPRAPVSLTLTATACIALSPLLVFLAQAIGPNRTGGEAIVVTEVAASMALVAFVTRWGAPWPAGLSTAALVAADLIALELRSEYARQRLTDFGFVIGFLILVSVATGLYFRARDRERSQTISVAVSGAQQSERMALARELHDVVAHHVTGIVVQAQAARLVAEKDPQVAVQALAKIESSGIEALKAMRFLVGSMRGAKPAGTSQATEHATMDLAADLGNVIQHFSGPPVTTELNLPEVVPHEVGRSVLRLVQESLTNVGKHALGARNVHVTVTGSDGELAVRVRDDGVARRADPVGGSGGYGLVGMRERVELLGGRFVAGPVSPVGWRVEAWLPLRKEDT